MTRSVRRFARSSIRLLRRDVVAGGDRVGGQVAEVGGANPRDQGALAADYQVIQDPEIGDVPGHGDLANRKELGVFVDLIEDVGDAARKAVERGTPAADAAAEYAVPEKLGDWFLFQPNYFERAFTAWERELRDS